MAITGFMSLEIDGNQLEGESVVASMDRQGMTMIRSFDHKVTVPYDAATGRASGKRLHGPFIVVKDIDSISPLICQAMCNNMPVSMTLKLFRPSQDTGAEEHYYTILLEDGSVSGIAPYLPMAAEEGTAHLPALEKVSFSYKRISWTEETKGATHVDDWYDEA